MKEWVCNCEGDWLAPESISCSACACAVSVWWCVCMVCVQNVDYAFILLFKMQFNMIMLSVWLLSFIIIIVNIKSKWVVFVSKLGIQWVSPLYLLYIFHVGKVQTVQIFRVPFCCSADLKQIVESNRIASNRITITPNLAHKPISMAITAVYTLSVSTL